PSFMLRGRKHFISNAPFAKRFVITAFEDLKRARETAALVVADGSAEGLTLGAPEKKMGQHLCPAAAVYFDDVVIPQSRVALISKPAESRQLMMDVLAFGRIGVAIMAVGSMRAALHEARAELEPAWLGQEWCQHELARLSEEIEACSRLAWSAAFEASVHGFHRAIYNPLFTAADRTGLLGFVKPSSGKRLSQISDSRRLELSALGSAVKASVTDRAMRLVHDIHRLAGLPAARRPGVLEKIFRDLKLLQIYEGPNLINRLNHFNMSELASDAGFRPFSEPLPPAPKEPSR
ncbi:MAG TPA: acyl-CoA dehydrogenase family protein, partial [Bdellovibrionales bacterium]|nr:acyl-CoA dehydrogenase family protein [Bdellovibrionales bacterium]